MQKRLNSQLFLLISFGFLFLINFGIYRQRVFAQDNVQEYTASSEADSKKLLKARQLLIEGTDCLHNNQNQQAKLKLAEACAIEPELPQAHHQLGIALAKLGENDDAADEFSKAIKLDPGLAASWLNLAAVYQSSGKIEQAKATYQDFVTKFPQDRDVSKIRSLIAVLDKEIASVTNTNGASSGLKAADNTSSVTENNTDDYYREITAHGIWLWTADHQPLKIYIEPINASNGAIAQYITILKNAFDDWAKASDGFVNLEFVNDASKAAVICSWSKDISKFKNSSEAANTKIYGDKSGLDKGELEILTVRPSDGKAITENQARATCLHEVGHVLGLTGHSINPSDVMYISATLKDSWLELSDRDRNTLIHLYSSNKK